MNTIVVNGVSKEIIGSKHLVGSDKWFALLREITCFKCGCPNDIIITFTKTVNLNRWYATRSDKKENIYHRYAGASEELTPEYLDKLITAFLLPFEKFMNSASKKTKAISILTQVPITNKPLDYAVAVIEAIVTSNEPGFKETFFSQGMDDLRTLLEIIKNEQSY